MKNKIKELLRSLYDLHEYDIKRDNALKLSDLIFEMHPKVTDKELESFFDCVQKGRYGVLYKSPTSLTSMYHKFIIDKNSLKKLMN